ncbi:hypothetical protein LEP3755_38630 [Leptolyngbya sp. NIES-3755]|nr:hypothetical protein LEP3755_38630 [Leptolyngbya sp. NIES-3755]
MADLTHMVSSSDPKLTTIEHSLTSVEPIHPGSENDRFLEHYQKFTGESHAELLWRVPTSSKQRKGWRDRGRDLLVEIIVKLIR